MKRLFYVIPLVCLLCFAFACQDKAAMAELEQFKAQAAVEEQNKALTKGFLEELSKGNIEIWKEMCAPEFAFYYPSEATEPFSLQQTYENFKMAFMGIPDLYWNIHELIAEGEKVVARFTVTGTHSGEYAGIPATGNKVKISVIVIFHWKDGKCVETREEEDALGMMQQLGMELKPKEAEK